MDIENAIAEFLQVERKRVPASLQSFYADFEGLYDLKLWHQLTLKVEEFARQTEAAPFLIPLYEHFVVDWEKKMNQIKLVLIAVATARQYRDFRDALEFMRTIQSKVNNDDSQDAYVLAQLEAGHFELLLGNLDATLAALEASEKILDGFNSVEPVIHASFYRVAADYYKAKADFGQYYKNALLYLACVSLDALSAAEKTERAHDLALAALLSEKIYNFGDLLMHPILDVLKDTEHAWLCDVLAAFNAGEIAKFASFAGHFNKQPLLQSHLAFLRQKVCLMTLIEVMFKHISQTRHIGFDIVAQEARLPLDEVEHLVMKALSLELIRGSIDQVEQAINLEWVQPRFLGKTQIKAMAEQLDQWKDKVHQMVVQMEQQSPELFVQN
ncbi:26S proteasome regulatory subunit [Dimargaris verticillata]|uniref:26S proteasome regulatory subunit n=1 Tax=Dimargaris verticillata TaxID=2761393 RepID=A0A9W8EDX3_9FUNG|nr:26S proteasome regulatory subunit [Dimargaris verticillata]